MDTQPDGKTFTWSRENTLQLLDLYKKYRNEVGSFQIRNFKKLWEIISGDMRVLYGAQVAPSNCENRWRVLERNYKRFIDNQNQTGGGRMFFEFSKEMESLLGKKYKTNNHNFQ
nr:unnamed protein product [Callosobruchus analis]